MTTRTLSKEVVFRRPFLLSGLASLQPAGTYVVDTNEEATGEGADTTWCHAATVIRLMHGASARHLNVDPGELHKALMRDGAQTELSVLSSASHKLRHRRARESMDISRTRGPRRQEKK